MSGGRFKLSERPVTIEKEAREVLSEFISTSLMSKYGNLIARVLSTGSRERDPPAGLVRPHSQRPLSYGMLLGCSRAEYPHNGTRRRD